MISRRDDLSVLLPRIGVHSRGVVYDLFTEPVTITHRNLLAAASALASHYTITFFFSSSFTP